MRKNVKPDALIAMNISMARSKLDMSQEDLAIKLYLEGCEITRGTIGKIEAGIRHVRADELRMLKKVLKVSYDYLIDGA